MDGSPAMARRRKWVGTVLRKGNNCERPVASVSRETAARAPEIPPGQGPGVRPTSRGSCRFPGRLAVRRAAWFRPAITPAFQRVTADVVSRIYEVRLKPDTTSYTEEKNALSFSADSAISALIVVECKPPSVAHDPHRDIDAERVAAR